MTAARAATRASTRPARVAPERAVTPRGVQTRQALLDAATRLFAERGYHETGVPDIVRAAGVSQGTFYQYFGHRRDVLVALAEIAHAATSARPPVAGRDFADLLQAEISWYLIESLRQTALAKVWHDAAVYDREIAAIMRTAREERAAQLGAAIVAIGAGDGIDPAIAAMAIVAMIETFTYRWCVEDGSPRTTADAIAAGRTLGVLAMRALGLSAS